MFDVAHMFIDENMLIDEHMLMENVGSWMKTVIAKITHMS